MPAFLTTIGRFLVRSGGAFLRQTGKRTATNIGQGVYNFLNRPTGQQNTSQSTESASPSTLSPITGLLFFAGVEPGILFALIAVIAVPIIILIALYQTLVTATPFPTGLP